MAALASLRNGSKLMSRSARLITRSRIKVYTMEDIDALGMREVVYRALRASGMGTEGIHVTLNMGVLDPIVSPGVLDPVRGGVSGSVGGLLGGFVAPTAHIFIDSSIRKQDRA